MFWSKSYYVCSIGNCPEDNIKKYIISQSGKSPIKKIKINS